MHDPIAYTYEADYHCPRCAESRFGSDSHGWIAVTPDGDAALDNEGNPVGVLAPWDEWYDYDLPGTQVLTCGTCAREIDQFAPVS